MNDRDRLLAEGPRVAPEPRMIADNGMAVVPSEPAAAAPPGEPRRSVTDAVRAGRQPRPWYFRALPAAVIGLVAIGRLLSSHSWAADVISVVWVIALLAFIARKAAKR